MIQSRGHFIDGGAGPVFVTEHRSRADLATTGRLMILPAFAEEMNKSRRMYTLLAARLAPLGIVTFVLDPYGSGDSGGDFADARWPIWIEDVGRAASWTEGLYPGCALSLLGHRLGALLSLAAMQGAGSAVERLIWWQPVLQGNAFLTQFLRLRLAGGLTQASGGGESTSSMRAEFAQGRSVEVAGYTLAAEFALALDALNAESYFDAALAPVHWLELQSGQKLTLPPARQKLVERMLEARQSISVKVLSGDPFWSLQEITDVEALLDASVEVFGSD